MKNYEIKAVETTQGEKNEMVYQVIGVGNCIQLVYELANKSVEYGCYIEKEKLNKAMGQIFQIKDNEVKIEFNGPYNQGYISVKAY